VSFSVPIHATPSKRWVLRDHKLRTTNGNSGKSSAFGTLDFDLLPRISWPVWSLLVSENSGQHRHWQTCGWRIVISPMIPQDSPSCYHSSMRNLAVLFIQFVATLARLLGPGGVRSIVAESLLLKHQLLIVNR
jgi:hypothetical protein